VGARVIVAVVDSGVEEAPHVPRDGCSRCRNIFRRSLSLAITVVPPLKNEPVFIEWGQGGVAGI
jgi:hypothetical protein